MTVSSPALLKDTLLNSLEREYRKKTAQVGFINIQQGVVVIPKGFNPEGIKENVQIFDFSLTEDDRH